VVGNSPNDLLDQRDRLVEELSGYLELRVRTNPADSSVMIDAGGVTLVGMDSSTPLVTTNQSGSGIRIFTPNGGILTPRGGSIAALDELDKDIIPGVVAQLDTLAATMAKRLNALHATGTSQAMSVTSFQSTFIVPEDALQTNLDSVDLSPKTDNGPGIPGIFLPSFTDLAGNAIARNLTINLRDTTTGEAHKYTLRYDPAYGTGTRSLQDLVTAINTGDSGGFSVVPANAIGIPGLRAKAVAVEGGWQLQLTADTNTAIDFSPALDMKPASQQWAGDDISVDTSFPIPASIGDSLQFTVERVSPASTNLQLRISSRNPADGSTISHGTISLSGAGTFTVPNIGGTGALDVTIGAGSYREGDHFVVHLDATGAVQQKGIAAAGTFLQSNEHVATDATMSIRGRYSGQLSLQDDPSGSGALTTWSMRVITAGTIGAKSSTIASAPQPPVVEFSYWTGTSGAPSLQTVRRTLDNTMPAGSPVQIADGVYAVFGAGTLTATDPGEDATFTVDAQPDQAGLLPAFGINGMFTGSTAASLKVSQRLVDDPTQLNVGLTRSEGDNSNVLRLIASRQEKLFDNGVFALDDTYNSTLSQIGVRIQQADRMSSNQQIIQSSLQNQRQQVSGVNIDEEMGQLIMQQQAYGAAARVITFARENIQTLLDLVR
jgi:flagellar hook-associated protein FlgK